jgi:hypothetical protein
MEMKGSCAVSIGKVWPFPLVVVRSPDLQLFSFNLTGDAEIGA